MINKKKDVRLDEAIQLLQEIVDALEYALAENFGDSMYSDEHNGVTHDISYGNWFCGVEVQWHKLVGIKYENRTSNCRGIP